MKNKIYFGIVAIVILSILVLSGCSNQIVKYKRAEFPPECAKGMVIIPSDAPESIQCREQKDCYALDMLKFDDTKCDRSVVTVVYRTTPIFT